MLFLIGVYLITSIIYGIIDLTLDNILLASNGFTIIQGYGYGWVSFVFQLSTILTFVLYLKLLIIYRRDLLRIQQLTHVDVGSYALFLYNVKAKTRDEDIIARITKELAYLKGTFAIPDELRRLAVKEKGFNRDTVLVPDRKETDKSIKQRHRRKGEYEKDNLIDHIFSLERIRDLNVYHAKRCLLHLETQYYKKIEANPQSLISKHNCGVSCLKKIKISKCMQACGFMRDVIWYKNAIKQAKMKVQKLEAMSSETSKGMAIVIFNLASARAAFYNHRPSYFGDRYMTIKGNTIRIIKAPAPGEVVWDNIHRGRPLFILMFICCLFLSLLLTSVVYLIITVIRAYQRILATQTASVITSFALSGCMYLVILLFDYMGTLLITKLVQLERHHTISAYETSYMLRYFIYIFINRLSPLYSRTILEYLNGIFNNFFVPLDLNNYYFFKIIDFTRDWRWGNDTPGHDILMYFVLATILDNTLDVILHYLQPRAWYGCRRKHCNNDIQYFIAQSDNSNGSDIDSNTSDSSINTVDESTDKQLNPISTELKYCCCSRNHKVHTRHEDELRLKMEYSLLYCRMASILTYSLSFGYAQPTIVLIASLYLFLQNVVGKCKLVYLSKPGWRFSTSLSTYFCNVLLTFSYIFAAGTLAQGYLSSTEVSPIVAISISIPTVILFSIIFNTATICALIRVCRCRRKFDTVFPNKRVSHYRYGMLSKEIDEERRFNNVPVYNPTIHGEYKYLPESSYSEKERTRLDILLANAISEGNE